DGSNPFANWPRLDEMIELLRGIGSKLGFRPPRVALVKQRLAVQVRDLDQIVVDDRDLADARTGKRGKDAAPDPPGADDRDLCRFHPPLPDAADLGQHDLPSVALELLVRKRH